jgi:hypothetical protein
VSIQPLFWSPATVAYGLPALISLLMLWNFIIILRDEWQGFALGLCSIIWAFLMFLSAGLSETYVGFQATALFIGVLLSVWAFRGQHRRTALIFIGLGLLGIITGGIIVILAPGNAVRLEVGSGLSGISMIDFIFLSLLNVSTYPLIDRYGTAISILILLLTPVFLLWWYRDNPHKMLESPAIRFITGRNFVLIGLICLSIIFVTVSLSLYGVGGLVSRAWILPRLVEIITSILWGIFLTIWLLRSGQYSLLKRRLSFRVVKNVLLITLLLYPIIVIGRNIFLARDLSVYASDWDARDDDIRASSISQDIVVTSPLTYNIEDYLDLEVANSDYIWVNDCMANYYGISRLEVEDTSQ